MWGLGLTFWFHLGDVGVSSFTLAGKMGLFSMLERMVKNNEIMETIDLDDYLESH